MAKTSKRLAKAYEGIDPDAPPLGVAEAVKLVKSNATAKFDETVEVAMNLNIDPRKQDQNVRGTVMLPHGTGKSVRVGVFARGDKAKEAEAAGVAKGSPTVSRGSAVGKVTMDQVREIAEKKMADLNANDVDSACKMIIGSARSMGIEVVGS